MNLCFLLFASSCRYFSALSKGECLPVKDRLEMNIANQTTDTGLTPGLLKVLHKQVFYSESVPFIQLMLLLTLTSFFYIPYKAH